MKQIAAVLVVLAFSAILFGVITDVAEGDENYNDHSYEHSGDGTNGDGNSPDQGEQAREEPRTRFKDK